MKQNSIVVEGTQEALDVSDFENDVLGYSQLQKKVQDDFLQGVIKLGGFLKNMQDKWKPLRKWGDYMEKTGQDVSMVNQFIRVYEYSIKNIDNLLDASITNWGKVNMFLALPDALKKKLGDEIGGVEISGKDFKHKVDEVTGEIIEDGIEVDSNHVPVVTDDDMEKIVSGSSLTDIHFMAKSLVTEMQKKGYKFTNKCIPIVEGFLSLEKAARDFDSKNFKELNEDEKDFWRDAILGRMTSLNKLVGL